MVGQQKSRGIASAAPGTTRALGPRLRERSCRVAVKEEVVIHGCPATVAATGAGVKFLGAASRSNVGAPDGTRTHDLQVRNLALYPLSYGRTLDSLKTGGEGGI